MPLTILGLFVLLFLGLRNAGEAVMVMMAVPFSLVGGFWLLYALGYQLSVAVAVGLIALAGVAAEFGVVMIVYLREAVRRNPPTDRTQVLAAVVEGAVQRVRPKAMTATVVAIVLSINLPAPTDAAVFASICDTEFRSNPWSHGLRPRDPAQRQRADTGGIPPGKERNR